MIVKAVRAAHVASSTAFVGLGDGDRSHYGGRRNVGYALGREDRRHFLHFMGSFPFDGSQSRLWACGPRQRNDPGPPATGCLLSSGLRCGRYGDRRFRSEEHTSELQSLMRTSYAVFCLKKKKTKTK